VAISGIGAVGATGATPLQSPQGAGGIRPQDWRSIELGLDPKGPTFADALKNALGEVNTLQETAKDAIAAFVRGDPVELHEVMAATEEAGIALEFLIEIRNKITDAYRTVISMQS
jgi:flagellar hook-basal body complex protein FliE